MTTILTMTMIMYVYCKDLIFWSGMLLPFIIMILWVGLSTSPKSLLSGYLHPWIIPPERVTRLFSKSYL